MISINAIQKKTILWALCVVLAAGWRPAGAQTDLSDQRAHFTRIQNGVELADGTSLLDMQIVENRLVCVHVRLDGKATPRTLVIDPNPVFRPPTAVTRADRNGTYTLSAPGVRVRIEEAKPYSITFLDSAGRQLLRSAIRWTKRGLRA